MPKPVYKILQTLHKLQNANPGFKTTLYGWLSKLWSLFGYPKNRCHIIIRTQKNHNFDSDPYKLDDPCKAAHRLFVLVLRPWLPSVLAFVDLEVRRSLGFRV